MSKLDRFPRFSNGRSKTLHNMSYDFKFTATTGHLNPVNNDILLPGDKIDYQPIFQVRVVQPMLAAAMVDIDFHVETFFVPMTMLWTPFEDFIYGVNGNYSSHYTTAQKVNLPLLDMQSVINTVNNAVEDSVLDNFNIGDCVGQSYVRLATLLAYNPNVSYHGGTGSRRDNFSLRGYGFKIFPWALLAYNCIWQNYYRLEDYTKYLQSQFNVDKFSSTITFDATSYGGNPPFMCMKYRPAYKDYFTSVKKSPLLTETNLLRSINADQQGNGLLNVYGDLSFQDLQKLYNPSGMPFGNVQSINNVDYQNNSPISLANSAPVSDQGDIAESFNGLGYGGSYQSTAQLRTLFANEKLLMITNRARKNYDSQTLAHFGVSVPHDVKHEISVLGSDTFKLSINELVSTAATEQASLGEYFGKGLAGKKTKRIKFTAPCHGVLMTIFSAVPHYDYIVDFQKKHLIQNRLNFFQPEYDALGMQPLYRYEVCGISPLLTTQQTTDMVNKDWSFDIQGWQYRYEEFKRNFNRATVAFQSSAAEPNVLAAWALTRRPYSLPTAWQYVGQGYYYNGSTDNIASRDYYTSFDGSRLYVTPHDVDQLFAAKYFTGWKHETEGENPEDWSLQLHNVFARDPFVVNSRIDYKKFSIMSTYSMPKLD